jgi:hypothetical protein
MQATLPAQARRRKTGLSGPRLVTGSKNRASGRVRALKYQISAKSETPSLVIIVIIWLSTTELRIGFVLIVLCTPVTIFCIYAGPALRAVATTTPVGNCPRA